MKRIKKPLWVIAAMICAATTAYAQTTLHDVEVFQRRELGGTARLIGMGGAMGALGGDLSAIRINPASAGVYRSNDFGISFGLQSTSAKGGEIGSASFAKPMLDNLGYLFSYQFSGNKAVRFLNFGINMRRLADYHGRVQLQGVHSQSQTQLMADMLNYDEAGTLAPVTPQALDAKDAYFNTDIPWLGVLGYDSHLVDPVFEEQPGENGGAPVRKIKNYHPYLDQGDEVGQIYKNETRGRLYAYDFSLSMNINERYYLGANITSYVLNYGRSTNYTEHFTDINGQSHGGYNLVSEYAADGVGVDLKLGFLVRPFEESTFKIGAAVQTPGIMAVRESQLATLKIEGLDNVKDAVKRPVDEDGNETLYEYRYSMINPWVFNVNAGYTLGRNLAVGIDYEYTLQNKVRLYDDGSTNSLRQTEDIKQYMQNTHRLAVGMEYKVLPSLAVRAGVNLLTSPLKSDAFKRMPSNTARLDTEYFNPESLTYYTCGLGYRGRSFYADVAYAYGMQKFAFYAFDNTELASTPVTVNKSKLTFTLGFRF